MMNQKAFVFGGGGLDGLFWLSGNPFLSNHMIEDANLYGTSAGAIYATGVALFGVEGFRYRLLEMKVSKRSQTAEFYKSMRSLVSTAEFPENLTLFAMDTLKWRSVPLTSGSGISLAKAVHASCAVPGIVFPAVHDRMLLFDGGIPEGSSNISQVSEAHQEVSVFAPFASPHSATIPYQLSANSEYVNITKRLVGVDRPKLVHPGAEAWSRMFEYWRPQGILHLVDPVGVHDFEEKDYLCETGNFLELEIPRGGSYRPVERMSLTLSGVAEHATSVLKQRSPSFAFSKLSRSVI